METHVNYMHFADNIVPAVISAGGNHHVEDCTIAENQKFRIKTINSRH